MKCCDHATSFRREFSGLLCRGALPHTERACGASTDTGSQRHGGIHEIIDDGVTGFLVPERNVTTLSDRLGRLLRDADLRARMGAAARAKMEREYDIRERVARLDDHYDEAVAMYRPPT